MGNKHPKEMENFIDRMYNCYKCFEFTRDNKIV